MHQLNKIIDAFPKTERMPLLFLGHGSPMNAIEENEFTRGWENIGRSLPHPSAILCISAHWETNGTFLTAMEHPRTIHDFYGFPQELFDVQYPAPGSPELAQITSETITRVKAELDTRWGLDHGCWSVVRRLYPGANVPVIQLSLDHHQSPQWHYDLAKDLSALRRRGVLIIGSGNMVHNLRILDWNNADGGYDWADEANAKLKRLIAGNDYEDLIRYQSLGKEIQLSVPTPEHFIPLLYIMGLKENNEAVSFFNDKTIFGSLSMTSLEINGGG